jgi:hypothetical protein
MQVSTLPHQTPYRALNDTPRRFGVGTIRHLIPFQTSASVNVFDAFSLEYSPTAVQALAAVHDTLVNWLF